MDKSASKKSDIVIVQILRNCKNGSICCNLSDDRINNKTYLRSSKNANSVRYL